MTRRESLRTIGGMLAAATAADAILSRPIPSSGEKLPVIGMGTWRTFDVTDDAQIARRKSVVKNLIARGGMTIDSSPMYGMSESVVGKVTADLGVNEELFLATKVWTTGTKEGENQIAESMRKFRRQKIDLLQIHNLVDWQTHIKTLRDLKEKGIVRYIGITHYIDSMHDTLAEVMVKEKLDFVQVNFNIDNRHAEERLLPTAADNGIAVIINRPFQEGALFSQIGSKQLPGWCTEFDCRNWPQFFLKYIISHPAVTCAIPATTNPAHMSENIGAAYGRLPDVKQRTEMVRFWDK